MEKTYTMTGTQALHLPDGRVIAPGAGDFRAILDPLREAFFVQIGALRRKAAEYHAEDAAVYHTKAACLVGNNIEPENRREGTGGKQLCKECAKSKG